MAWARSPRVPIDVRRVGADPVAAVRGERTRAACGSGPWFHGGVTTTIPEPALTAADRCDRCGAQAYVRVTLPAGPLYFCAHHGRALAPALEELAVEIHDETGRLTPSGAR